MPIRTKTGCRQGCLAVLACLLLPSAAAAQTTRGAPPSLHVRAGVTASGTLVRDLIATPQVRQLLGQRVDEDVRVTLAPGPSAGLVLRVPLRPRLALDAGLDLIATELRATDAAGTRSLQDAHIIQAGLAAAWRLGRRLDVGAGVGVVSYLTEDEGLFAEGGQLLPLLETSAAWTLPFWAERVALSGTAQVHRFTTPAMRHAGGEDGMVSRFSLLARVRLLEVGR